MAARRPPCAADAGSSWSPGPGPGCALASAGDRVPDRPGRRDRDPRRRDRRRRGPAAWRGRRPLQRRAWTRRARFTGAGACGRIVPSSAVVPGTPSAGGVSRQPGRDRRRHGCAAAPARAPGSRPGRQAAWCARGGKGPLSRRRGGRLELPGRARGRGGRAFACDRMERARSGGGAGAADGGSARRGRAPRADPSTDRAHPAGRRGDRHETTGSAGRSRCALASRWGSEGGPLSYARPDRARDRDEGGPRSRRGKTSRQGADPTCGSDPKETSVMTTVLDVQRFKEEGRRFAVLTAYDYLSAKILDEAGIPILLVGDSLGMVMLGYPTTLPVTVDEMIHHARAVAQAITAAGRFIQEGGMHAVKLEGGGRVVEITRRLADMGIPVMGHLGLTPQYVHQMGGFKVQGKSDKQAARILADARELEQAGAFSIVLEGVPADVATRVTKTLRIPTIGIGAGAGTDGQVLVFHDMLGLTTGKAPKFVKRYANLAAEITSAAQRYVEEVGDGTFPGD